MLQSVKQNQEISMEDMAMVLDMVVLDMVVLDMVVMGLVFTMVRCSLEFRSAFMLTWIEFQCNKNICN